MKYGWIIEGQEEKQEQEEIPPIQVRDEVDLNWGDTDGEKGTNLGNILEVKYVGVRKRGIRSFIDFFVCLFDG